ncbi:aminotransferase class V-fold PLP-dependent enzyme [Thermodesulfobacteriota bacterium]
MEHYRDYFPVTKKMIYFNHAAVAPLSCLSIELANYFLEDSLINGSMNYPKWLKNVAELKRLASELINSSTDEIAIAKNTTSGILYVANGLDLQEGDNIIIPEKEFPANVYPWLNLKSKGVEVRFCKWNDGRIEIQDLLNLVDKNTRLLSISHVQFTNGFKIDLTVLGRELKKRGVLFFVDAIQSMGVFEIDVNKMNIDFLAADSHKWMLGPEGVGFFYCKKENLDKLRLTNFGYTSVINSSDYLNYDMTLRPDASRFEEGSLNMLGIHAAIGSLKLINDVGISRICKSIIDLTDHLSQRLAEVGCKVLSPRYNEIEKSGILSFIPLNETTEELYKRLMQNNCYVALRDNAIRISPHFYNSLEEADKFIGIVQNQ